MFEIKMKKSAFLPLYVRVSVIWNSGIVPLEMQQNNSFSLFANCLCFPLILVPLCMRYIDIGALSIRNANCNRNSIQFHPHHLGSSDAKCVRSHSKGLIAYFKEEIKPAHRYYYL